MVLTALVFVKDCYNNFTVIFIFLNRHDVEIFGQAFFIYLCHIETSASIELSYLLSRKDTIFNK